MPTPTLTEAAVTEGRAVSQEVRWFLGPARSVLDETTIVGAWTPIGVAGWTDRSGDVLGSAEVAMTGRGYQATFTVADEARATWADDLAVAVCVRSYLDGAYTAWALLCLGYLDGSGTQRRGVDLLQTGDRLITYTGYWEQTNLPAHRFGTRNLMDGASLTGSTGALSTPSAEAPKEYISQDDCTGTKAIDGNVDTVAISPLLADAAPPGTIGQTADPRLAWLYAGRTSRTPGAGNEPIAVGLYCQRDALGGWGAFTNAGTVPNLSEQGTNQPNNSYVVGTIDTGNGKYIARILAQPGNPDAKNYVQWNIGTPNNVPLRLELTIKAGSTPSIGRTVLLQAGAFDGGVKDTTITLSSSWSTYTFDYDNSGARGFLFRPRAGRLELATDDLYYEFRLKLYAGYCDESPDHGRLFLAYDNGAGEQRWIRPAFDLTNPAWTIPPGKLVFLVDDPVLFKAKFDPGDALVLGLKNLFPGFYFGPGVGKLKLAYNTNPLRNDYSGGTTPYTGGGTLIEEINFATNGLTWSPFASLERRSPSGTGGLVVNDYPQPSLNTASSYGPSWWQYSLPTYVAPRLTAPVSIGGTRLPVDDSEEFPPSGNVYVGNSPGPYGVAAFTGKDGDSLILAVPLLNAYGVGTQLWAEYGGARRTTWLVDGVRVRRKPGTPQIADGKVITTSLPSPGSPSPDYERGTDWDLYGAFADVSDEAALAAPEGPRPVAGLTAIIARMAQPYGVVERGKVNEIVAYQHKPGNAAGGWVGHAVTHLSAVLGHLLTQHGSVPLSKVSVVGSTPQIGDLPVTPTTLAQAVDQLCRSGRLTVTADPYGAVTIAPDPASPAYTAATVVYTFTEANVLGTVEAGWTRAHAVAQVRYTAREAASMRVYTGRYPSRPAQLGQIVELRDLLVRSGREAVDSGEAEYRSGNARRSYRFSTGFAPWLRWGDRVVCDFPSLDASGAHVGINCYVAAIRHTIRVDRGGAYLTSALELREAAL